MLFVKYFNSIILYILELIEHILETYLLLFIKQENILYSKIKF